MSGAKWRPWLGAKATQDLIEIVEWSRNRFGPEQALSYRQTILAAIRELEQGPDFPGVRDRSEILPGLKSLHVARHGARGRHLVIFRVDPRGERFIEILRILHDAMDFARHVPPGSEMP
jgi:toxin ParE1/3/4